MIKVLKFGGTSVGSAANMKKVAEIVRREQARITVLSAMSGTTDSLVRISRAAASGDRNAIEEQLVMLTDKYTRCIEELLRERKQQALARMNATFGLIRDEAAAFEEYESERKIIAQGELLTSAIFTAYLQETGLKAECLYSPDFMVKDPGEKVDTERIGRALARVAGDDSTFFVAQGFICSDSQGRIDNLGRGGSDYGAALMDVFNRCRRELPIGYAAFHLPRVLEWLTAGRQYKQAYELLRDFPIKLPNLPIE